MDPNTLSCVAEDAILRHKKMKNEGSEFDEKTVVYT